jgi:hypothetical protein
LRLETAISIGMPLALLAPAVGGKFFACERSPGGASSIKMPAFHLVEVVLEHSGRNAVFSAKSGRKRTEASQLAFAVKTCRWER